MYDNIPSKNLTLLKSLIGTRIVFVSRYIFKSDFDLDDFQQNADGSVEITFDNGTVTHFSAFTTGSSVAIFEGKAPLYGESYVYMDVSHNSFWSSRIGQKITNINILQLESFSADYPAECVLEIIFENNTRACIEYIDENEKVFDALTVTSEFYESNLIRHQILTSK